MPGIKGAGMRRMRHPGGNEQLLNQLNMHFKVPPPDPSSPASNRSGQESAFRKFIYLTQVPTFMLL